MNFFGLGLPIPPPFPVPTPNPDLLDTADLWSYDNLSNTVSAFRTVMLMADQHSVVTVFVVGAFIVATVYWLSRLVGSREENV